MAETTQQGHDSELRERPVGELVKQLSEQTATLVRQEMELARAELARKGAKVGAGGGMLGTGAVLGWFALAALTAAAVLGLAEVVDAWLAALIVGAAYALAAAALALAGRRRIAEAGPPVPEETVESVKEDVEWTRRSAQAGRR